MLLRCAFLFIFLLLTPGEALAWGIGVHLQLGSHILANLQQLPPLLQTLLGAYPQEIGRAHV